DFRRAQHRCNVRRCALPAVDEPAGSLRVACAPASLSSAAPFAVQGTHVSGFGRRWLRHTTWRWWYALAASAALSTRPRAAAVGIGPAYDADRGSGDGHESTQRMDPATLWISPDIDREYGHAGANHVHVLA